ncbi:MAG: xanthine dehydrogenase family protein molybdopterin-binding subunit [Bacillota bacterium]
MMEKFRTIGKNELRVDARDKVSGKALYPADIYMENMAYGYTIRSVKPHAELKVDKSRALSFPGVLHVFTAEDVPGKNHHGVLFKDHEVFCSHKTIRIGEPIAFVVAESMEAAREAAKLVEIEYKELPAVFDPVEAMKEDAPKIHGDSNIIYHYKLRKGDIDKAFAECEVIVENTYETSMVDHVFLQPEAGVSYIEEDGTITIIVATQYPHYDREEVAEALGLPHEKIRILTAAVGGAFGGREDITVQIHLALAAIKLNRPIKTIYTREESFQAHSKRHPMLMKFRTGALKDGTLHAMEAEIIGDSGAHASWAINVLRKAGVHATGPYCIPNVKVDSYAVYTNNPFTGAMRGFGAAQVPMAYEQQVDEIARRLNINPVEIRLKNCFRPGSETATGQVLEESVPLAETIIKAAKEAGFEFHEGVR